MASKPSASTEWSIATRLFALQLAAVVILAGVAIVALVTNARATEEQDAAARALTMATSIALNPFVIESLARADPSLALEPYTLRLTRDTGMDFVTIMRPDRTRLTHPDRAQIGLPFQGTIGPALTGRSFTETFPGTLGPSVRAVVPIRDSSGAIVALVSSGITVATVSVALGERLPSVILVALLVAAAIAIASFLLSRYLRKATWGRGPEQLTRMFSFYDSVLHSVREGLVLTDRDGTIVLYNEQAADMLGLPKQRATELHDDDPGRGVTMIPTSEISACSSLSALLASGATVVDELHLTDSQVLVVNQEPAIPSGRFAPRVAVGTVTTLRDHTEVTRLTSELESTASLSGALRSQTHEFANRLHTIVSLIELGREKEALAFATAELAAGQELADRIMTAIDEPVLAALLLGKSAHARERGVDLHLDSVPGLRTTGLTARDLVTIVGNLVDNAIDAAGGIGEAVEVDSSRAPVTGADIAARDVRWVEVYLANDTAADGAHRLVLQVADSGRGLDSEQFATAAIRGISSKPHGINGRGVGLALVVRAVHRLDGTIDSHRRSDAGEPSSIIVELPLSPPAPLGATGDRADAAWPSGAGR